MAGRFIVLEGIDGAGTTTLTRILGERLREQDKSTLTTREPSDGPVGKYIRTILSSRSVQGSDGNTRAPSWEMMALLFAADRLDHIRNEIEPALLKGTHVISDRYDYSSLAYQLLSAGETKQADEWIRTLNQHCPRPDLTLVLDVDAKIAQARRAQRQGNQELFDDDEFQRKLARVYRELKAYYPKDRIVIIDANQSVEDVASAALLEVKSLFA